MISKTAKKLGIFIQILLIISLITYLFISIKHFSWKNDGGITLANVFRLSQKQQPYRDFFSLWMPSAYYLLQIIWYIFSPSLLTLRILLLTIFGGLYSFVYFTARKLKLSPAISLTAVLVAILPNSLPSYNPNWLGLFTSFIYLFSQNRRKQKTSQQIIDGLLIGLTYSFIQWQGLALITAFILNTLKTKDSLSQKIKNLTIPLISATLIPAIWFGYYLRQGNLLPIIQQTLLFPFTQYSSSNMNLPCLLWWILLGWNILFFTRRKKLDYQNFHQIWFCGFSFWLISLISPSSGHVSLSLLFYTPLICFYLKKLFPQETALKKFTHQQITDLLRQIKFWQDSIQRLTLYGLNFFFIFVIGIQILSNYQQITQQKKRLITPQGTIWVDEKWEQTHLQIEPLIIAENNIFIGPWIPAYYYFYQKIPPTRFSHLGPEHFHSEILKQLITDLQTKQTSTVIFLPSQSPAYQAEENLLTDYLQKNFVCTTILPTSNRKLKIHFDAIWKK